MKPNGNSLTFKLSWMVNPKLLHTKHDNSILNLPKLIMTAWIQLQDKIRPIINVDRDNETVYWEILAVKCYFFIWDLEDRNFNRNDLVLAFALFSHFLIRPYTEATFIEFWNSKGKKKVRMATTPRLRDVLKPFINIDGKEKAMHIKILGLKKGHRVPKWHLSDSNLNLPPILATTRYQKGKESGMPGSFNFPVL
ncbi:hypothetical protein CEXT_722891 [Caerostris extrusa]|uniref:Uncharacterized protein n=1 Tax=Caerostris extrusa TaxID=172846 RepID=A0AAV4RD23_CAEEX|nr:hypothetical protein CEXT_722891 [Caerostris extrusa]